MIKPTQPGLLFTEPYWTFLQETTQETAVMLKPFEDSIQRSTSSYGQLSLEKMADTIERIDELYGLLDDPTDCHQIRILAVQEMRKYSNELFVSYLSGKIYMEATELCPDNPTQALFTMAAAGYLLAMEATLMYSDIEATKPDVYIRNHIKHGYELLERIKTFSMLLRRTPENYPGRNSQAHLAFTIVKNSISVFDGACAALRDNSNLRKYEDNPDMSSYTPAFQALTTHADLEERLVRCALDSAIGGTLHKYKDGNCPTINQFSWYGSHFAPSISTTLQMHLALKQGRK